MVQTLKPPESLWNDYKRFLKEKLVIYGITCKLRKIVFHPHEYINRKTKVHGLFLFSGIPSHLHFCIVTVNPLIGFIYSCHNKSSSHSVNLGHLNINNIRQTFFLYPSLFLTNLTYLSVWLAKAAGVQVSSTEIIIIIKKIHYRFVGLPPCHS